MTPCVVSASHGREMIRKTRQPLMAPDGGSKTYHTHDDNTTSKELYTHTFNTILQLLSPKSGHIVGSIFSQYKNFHKNSKIKALLVLYVKYFLQNGIPQPIIIPRESLGEFITELLCGWISLGHSEWTKAVGHVLCDSIGRTIGSCVCRFRGQWNSLKLELYVHRTAAKKK